ncbi:alpha/beta fold hydrolase [Streptomyces sp. FR-108]|uniref:alpha/beta fold hydrolase n=1 Tax=Streptomyces sp. FR-108 TaxID=3416665 RepID=UPI003CE81A99
MNTTLIATPDGRKLQFEAAGPDGGIPLVFHNTTPGSARPYRALKTAAEENGLRLITFARAGYGLSTRKPGRIVADAAADVAFLLDHLSIQRCLVLGWSGGGPHALATAALLADRVAAVASVSGFAPFDAHGLDFFADMGQANVDSLTLAQRGEAAIAAPYTAAAAAMTTTTGPDLTAHLATLLSDNDRGFLSDAQTAQDVAATVATGVRYGAAGLIDDDLAFVEPWGFDIRQVAVPAFVWQGGQDLMVPYTHGEWLSEQVPGAVPRLLKSEGHFSVALGRTAEIVNELLEAF